MMTEQDVAMSSLSMEAIPSGLAMPDWLVESLLKGRRLLVIHPSEECRKQAIENLYRLGVRKSVDTTHHLTVKRLIGILHLDLRLPVLMEDDGILFEKTHRALAETAANHGFPLLLTNPNHRWSRSRSRRLLSLYRELTKLRKPWSWEEDPGAKSCDKVLKSLESEMQATHPLRLERTVWKVLGECEEAPFTIADVEGIIVLDHPSGLSEVELAILQQLSKFTGMHQLVNPGSHRLGFHGEYIEDIAPIRSSSNLPEWVPQHEVWAPKTASNWSTRIGEDIGRQIHHVMCDLHEHTPLALADILNQINGEIVVVSGDAENLKLQMKPYLESMGYQLNSPSIKVCETSAVSRILSFAKLPRGEEAWSLNRLSEMWSQIELPMSWPILEMQHPIHDDWKPRLHPSILSEIARGFHLLGGRGALRRWYYTLSQASPRAGVNPEQRMRELEECQWWLACIANWMHPILSRADQEVVSQGVTGCSSGESLPLPQQPSDIVGWINSCMEQIDWQTVTSRDKILVNSLPGLQHFMASISRLQNEGIDFEAEGFYEVLEVLSNSAEIPSIRSGDKGIRILSPSQAYGLETEYLILCGIDAETWSMKTPQIPWLDEANRMRIGLHRPDEPLRIARHHLRHFLNCSPNVLIIDSSIEEGVELAGPLDEWFSDISQQGGLESLKQAPPYFDADLWHPDTADRTWVWKLIDGESKLVYRVVSMESSDNGVRTHRSGRLNRDRIQRAGISSIESRNPAISPLNVKSLLVAAETEILTDQLSRRRIGDNIGIGEIHPFTEAPNRMQSSDIKLIPTKTKPANGRDSDEWPHLGIMGKKGLGIPVDPRPISPPSTRISELDNITGRGQIKLNLPKVWSQGRLQSWLECPRRAWFERHMYLGKSDNLNEDLAATTRGDIIHQIEEAILRGHGVKEGEIVSTPTSLIDGSIGSTTSAWEIALNTLAEKATWMRREDGISAHRCRDLIGVSPAIWNEWLENGTPIEIGGRIGRMIQSDFSLLDVAPIASEWELISKEGRFVRIGLPESSKSFLLRGRIDRVDQLLLEKESECDEIIPLDFETKSPPKSARLIILRDIKSLDGTKDNGENERHLKGLFHELQLALYARAWEIANPGDRVIGVGATQVGNQTQQYLEIDPEFSEICSQMQIGVVGNDTHGHYRLPGDSKDETSNPFRAWMRERITTAMRVIENAESGNIHPEPSNLCKYCPIIDACPSAKRGGW
jgi:hypothetical protein